VDDEIKRDEGQPIRIRRRLLSASDMLNQRRQRTSYRCFYGISVVLALLVIVEWRILTSPTSLSWNTTDELEMQPRKEVALGQKQDYPTEKKIERIVMLRIETYRMSKELLAEIKEEKDEKKVILPDPTR